MGYFFGGIVLCISVVGIPWGLPTGQAVF
ncbi:MAG: hypothetical protein WAT20_12165 [Ferruginibacter sp.]